MQRKLMRTGFTLVELSISIVFIAILSLAVTFVIMDTVSSYRRGLTLNQINTTGTDIVDDMMSAVQGSPAQALRDNCGAFGSNVAICLDDDGLSFATVTRSGTLADKDNRYIATVPLYGAFCTGSYSYLWNSGYYFDGRYNISPVAPKLKISKNSDVYYDSGDKPFKLLKIKDEGRVICSNMLNNGSSNRYLASSNSSNTKMQYFRMDLDNVDPDSELMPKELIAKESNLALYDLDIGNPAMGMNDRSMLYPVSFILGTIQGGINITTLGDGCTPPEDTSKEYYENFDYCSINKFNFAAQAIGG